MLSLVISRRLVLVALVSALVGGAVQGQNVPVDFSGAVNDFARVPGGWKFTPGASGPGQLPSLRPAVTLAGGGSLTTPRVRTLARSVGRWAVRWSGWITVGASVIYSALDWFYQEAQRSTGTPLDDWYWDHGTEHWPPLGPQTRSGSRYEPSNRAALANISLSHQGRFISMGAPGYCVFNNFSVFDTGVAAQASIAHNSNTKWQVFKYGDYRVEDAYQELEDFYYNSIVPNCPLVSESLYEHLIANPSSERAADEILRDGLQERANRRSWPATYGAPYAPWDVSVTPAPNQNQWYGNPYADPTIDTDGDGYEDWREAESETDPNDPDHYPTVPVVVPVRPDPGDPDYDPVRDPSHPDYDPDQDPWRDSDGDGIPDRFDPCARDALNRCMDAAPEYDPASEDTLQEIRDLLQEIRDQEKQEEDEQDDVMPADFGPLTLLLPEWTPGAVTESAFAAVSTAMETTVNGAIGDGGGKLPFLLSGWVPIVALTGGDECSGISMDILGHTQQVGVCDTPVHTVLATTARTAILALAVIAFWLGMVRWVSQS